jgi:ribosomal protein S18 acetylase RimI-like enzyme
MDNILKLKNKNGKIVDAFYKELDITYIDKIMELQDIIIDALEDKQLFAPTSKEEFINCIENGKIIGYLDKENNIIAIVVYVKNGCSEENYGYDLALKGDDLLRVAQVESVVVREEYRGNGLQRILCNKIEDIAMKDKIKILTATASPYNKYSVNTFISLGYEIKMDKFKYGGVRRYVFAKEIND